MATVWRIGFSSEIGLQSRVFEHGGKPDAAEAEAKRGSREGDRLVAGPRPRCASASAGRPPTGRQEVLTLPNSKTTQFP